VAFGTSNAAVASFDGETVRLVKLEVDGPIMPTATYIDREFHTKTGDDAIRQYIVDNTGRTVELVPEVIGRASVLVAERGASSREAAETLTQDVYSQSSFIDLGLQGRLFRGVKRLLGLKDMRRLMVFDHPFRLVALITPILLRMQQTLCEEAGQLSYGHLGHPVNFEGRYKHKNSMALTRLGEAYRYAGIEDQHFYPEPIAAAVSYLNANPNVSGEHLLTLDFGGGTLDFCVLRRAGRRFEVVATHGIALGGDHIDQRLFRKLLFPLLGKGETWRRRGMDREIETRFPFEDYEELLVNWAVTYTLNQNKYTTAVMDCIEQGGASARKFRRLRELIKHNLSYVMFQAIKDFKAELSASGEAVLDIPEIDVEISLTRADFEMLIGDLLTDLEQALDDTLSRAGLATSDIDIVLRTGGSSLIPAVREILDQRFPAQVVEHDPFTSVAAGLAIANYQGLRA
ncbi:MAG: Hsp70 family protein, partial [Proteobacteria bacterium]|nr:Hsp70 family protein [Pseudomonadota bacterium]